MEDGDCDSEKLYSSPSTLDDEGSITSRRDLRRFTQMPRLEALRQKLKFENNVRRKSSDVSVQNNSVKKNSVEQKDRNLSQLIEQLEFLPTPKEPLVDKFNRHHSYLRISLSERCNLRCLYCMPEDGVPLQPSKDLLSNKEILQLATWFNQHGVNKIRLTGGEPLLRNGIVDIVSDLNTKLHNPLQQIGITTNGVTLSKKLPDLVHAGLTHVNISLDSLDPDKFARLTRRPASYHERVMSAIEDCARLLPYRTKINCVVMPDNVNELQTFCDLSRDMPVDVRFIEYMPFNENKWQTNEFVSYQQMREQIHGLEREEDGPNDTTKWWRLQPNGDRKSNGRIGFITSMTEHFCGTCNRLRLTADGQLKVCLFGKTEVSLRDLLRRRRPHEDRPHAEGENNNIIDADDLLQKLIHFAVNRKHFKLGGHKDMEDLQAHSTENRPMTLIGG